MAAQYTPADDMLTAISAQLIHTYKMSEQSYLGLV